MNISFSLLCEVRRWMSTPSTRSDIDIKLRIDPVKDVVDSVRIKKPMAGFSEQDFDKVFEFIEAIPGAHGSHYTAHLVVSEVHLTCSAGYHEIEVECLICHHPHRVESSE